MRLIRFIKTPKINGNSIITPPIAVRSDVPLPVVGEMASASSDQSDTVLMGEVVEVNEAQRTFVARFNVISWEQGKKQAVLAH